MRTENVEAFVRVLVVERFWGFLEGGAPGWEEATAFEGPTQLQKRFYMLFCCCVCCSITVV